MSDSHPLERSGEDSLAAADPRVADALRRLAAAPALTPALPPGALVAGRYAVEHRLGRGGMGVVYLAHDRELDRRVALKLHRSADDPRAAARMMREARAMARLTHPNVVAVYEVGAHDERLFIAMEWVDGVDLRAWLAAEPRPRAAIVERFLGAGEGLAAAHRAGLIHADFKPDNVLIGVDGRVRVSDFGLARAMGSSVSERTDGSAGSSAGTRDGAIGGTPAYMSPEQAAGDPVDARSDQYSFCVALWEALHGALPARDGSPPRSTLPVRHLRALRRGLQERPGERFPDMAALLAALRPRRLGWLVAGALASVAAASLALGAALAPTAGVSCTAEAWQADAILPEARREALARRFAGIPGPLADEAGQRVERALAAYADDLSRGSVEACADTHARGVQSEDRLDLRMGCLTRARRELDAAVEVLTSIEGPKLAAAVPLVTGLPDLTRCADPEALHAGLRPAPGDPGRRRAVEDGLAAARARQVLGAYGEARDLAAALAADVDALADPHLVAAQREVLGDIRLAEMATDEARASFEEGYLAARTAGDELRAGRLAAALARLRTTYLAEHRDALWWTRIAREELARGGGDRRVAVDLYVIEGSAHAGLGDLDVALARYDAAAEELRRRGSPRPDHLAVILSHRGIALDRLGRHDAAIAAEEEALQVLRDVLGAHHPKCVDVLNLIGAAQAGAGREGAAEARYLEALELGEATFGADHPALAPTLTNLAVLDGTRGRYEAAIGRLERVDRIYASAAAPNPAYWAAALAMLGEYHGDAGDPQAGLALLDRALALERETFGDGHARVAECRMRRAEALGRTGELAGALEEQLAAAEQLGRILGPDSTTLADSLTIAGQQQHALGRLDEAEATLARALAIWDRIDRDHPQAAYTATFFGALLVDLGRASEALPRLEQAVRIREAGAGARWRLAESRWHLARALWDGGGDRQRAVALAQAASEGLAPAGQVALDTAVQRWLEQRLAALRSGPNARRGSAR